MALKYLGDILLTTLILEIAEKIRKYWTNSRSSLRYTCNVPSSYEYISMRYAKYRCSVGLLRSGPAPCC